MATISKVLAAFIAVLWGASMVFAGAFGVQPGTNVAKLAIVVGVILLLLAIDQLVREIRKLT